VIRSHLSAVSTPVSNQRGIRWTFARQAEARCGASEDPRFTMRAMQDLAARINQAEGLDDLLDSILAEAVAASGGR